MSSVSDMIYNTARMKSTFGSAQKDLFKIVDKLIENDNVKKLLYYQDKNSLDKPNLTAEQSIDLIHKNIRVIPRLPIEEDVKSYIIIGFDNFVPNETNPVYRDNIITFDVLCHLDTWIMSDYKLRPYLIMGEIDGMINKKKLNGIGTAEFIGANQLILSDELAGFTLTYKVINDADR